MALPCAPSPRLSSRPALAASLQDGLSSESSQKKASSHLNNDRRPAFDRRHCVFRVCSNTTDVHANHGRVHAPGWRSFDIRHRGAALAQDAFSAVDSGGAAYEAGNELDVFQDGFGNDNESEDGDNQEDEHLFTESVSQVLSFGKAEEDEDEDDEDEEVLSVAFEEEFDVTAETESCTKNVDDVQSTIGNFKTRSEKVSVKFTFPGDEAKRIQKFCAKLQERSEYLITTQDLASIYSFPLDKFQLLAMEGILKGSSVVVCAPTSSGKTLVAEAATAVTLARRKRLLYTTPLKALSNQKWREFRTLFGESNVGLVTGDVAVNKEAPILIMTAEILRNMLYQSVGNKDESIALPNVDAVVLDEVHYLSDFARGTTWEEIIIYCPKKIQLICLSATVANPEELSGWIAQVHGPTELVVSSRRPVPLLWHFSTRHCFFPLLNKKSTEMNRELLFQRHAEMDIDMTSNAQELSMRRKQVLSKRSQARSQAHESGRRGGSIEMVEQLSEEQMQIIRRKQVPQIRDTLRQLQARDMLPAIWFIFSRRGCDIAVHYQQDIQLLSEKERKDVRGALRHFRKQHPEAIRESAVTFLFRGVAAHHAGCLPLWKSFIEELFQRGLVKVVFATETLAAGMNMPARTTVLSALSKKGDKGLQLLSANAMLQMAGRAGRRGIDTQGHVVVVQTPFEGAEECCKLLFAGSDALVSQFTATYGMALNLLAGTRVMNVEDSTSETPVPTFVRRRRTLEEARALVEQSFGNYLGREVVVKAKEKAAKLQLEIQNLETDNSSVDDSGLLKEKIGKEKFKEYVDLRQRVQDVECVVLKQKQRLEVLEAATTQARLKEIIKNQFSFICLSYVDDLTNEEHLLPAICIDYVSRKEFIRDRNNDEANTTFKNGPEVWGLQNIIDERGHSEHFTNGDDKMQSNFDYHYYVALGADNNWYLLTEKSVKNIFRTAVSEYFGAESSFSVLKDEFWLKSRPWKKAGRTQSDVQTIVYYSEGSLGTLPLSRKVPLRSELTEDYQVSEEFISAQKKFVKAKFSLTKWKKKFEDTEGFKMHNLLCDLKVMRKEKMTRKKAKVCRIEQRIKQMQPSGWKEFLQVVQVLRAAGAIDTESNELLPLGESALAMRGVNELWLALALSTASLNTLKPAELAAICGTLVGEGTKLRPGCVPSALYEPSSVATCWIQGIESQRQWLLDLQTKNGVEFPCELDSQFAGLVEAWALGVNWKELMMDCAMDEGDVARLLRRTIDLLTQIPFLPRVGLSLAKTARIAAEVMDRPPISELVA